MSFDVGNNAFWTPAASPDELLTAMKLSALQDQTKLSYVNCVEVVPDDRTLGPITQEPTIFLAWKGSPKTLIGESAATKVWRAEHNVEIIICKYTASPIERVVFGDGHDVGMLQFVSDVLDFYESNTFGWDSVTVNGAPAGLNQEDRPTIEAPADSAEVLSLEGTADFTEDEFLVTARLRWVGWTVPFGR